MERAGRSGLEALLLSLLLLGVGLLHIDHPPRYDELFHVLAGQSWAEDGSLGIGDGAYRRARLFTVATGAMFAAFGDSLVVGRLVPLAANVLLAVALFLWMRRFAGRRAAWIAALMLGLSINWVYLSQFIRFYSLHALLFFVAAIAAFILLKAPPRPTSARVAVAAGGAAALGLAFHLQVTTLVGVAGIVAWWALTSVLPQAVADLQAGKARRWLIAGTALLAIAAATLLLAQDLLASLWTTYTWQARWAQGTPLSIYHWILLDSFPAIYMLLPAIAVASLLRNPAVASFGLVVWLVGMGAHTFGGMRGEHYIYYLLPFLMMPAAIALDALLGALGRLGAALAATLPWGPVSPAQARAAGGVTIAATLVFLWAGNPAWYKLARFIAEGPGFLHAQHRVDWRAARPPLLAAATNADVVVSTNGLSALRDLGRMDVEFSATILFESGSGEEFSRYGVTGRPVISQRASLEALMSCFASGLVVSEAEHWGSEVYGVPPDAVRVLQQRARPVPLPTESGLIAYRWAGEARAPAPAYCPALRASVAPTP